MKKLFRKLHLWLSVPFGIFITLICFSGAMLVFEKEITEWCRPDLYFVNEVKEKPLPLDQLMETVAAGLPDSVSITGVTISPEAERAYQVGLSKPRRAALYVDQYTGEVKGRSERLPFYDTMFHLHRWMMGDSTGFGKLLVGVSTLMLVIILLTGLLMWLTNRRKPLAKSLKISFTKGWPRFWHDLHVAGGIYATIFLLALALTGLTWSFSWYRTGFYGMFGVEASAGGHPGGREGGGEAPRERGGRPEGRRHGGEEAHARRDSARDDAAEHRGRRHEAESEAARPRREAKPETVREQAAPVVADTEAPAVQAEDVQPVAEEHVHAHDEAVAEERGHRGRGGREGRGRHRREAADSTGKAAGHHRSDSVPAYTAGSEAAVRGERAGRQERTSDSTRVAERSRGGKRRAEGRAVARAEVRQERVAEAPQDTVTADVQPQVSSYACWQKVYEELAETHPGYRQITLSDGSAGVVPEGRNSLRSTDRFDFDSESGQITGSKPYSEQDKSSKVRSAVYTVHVGSWGGMFTRILTFLAALLGATLPLTGYYLWLRRLINKSSHKRPKTGD